MLFITSNTLWSCATLWCNNTVGQQFSAYIKFEEKKLFIYFKLLMHKKYLKLRHILVECNIKLKNEQYQNGKVRFSLYTLCRIKVGIG